MFDHMDKSNINHPFANKSFLDLLENSQCVSDKSGWLPHHFETTEEMLPSYIKFHSYGEYIFDWAWANFYQQNGLNYYPKLIHAIPFTPVNAPKFIGNSKDKEKLAKMSFDFYFFLEAGKSGQNHRGIRQIGGSGGIRRFGRFGFAVH